MTFLKRKIKHLLKLLLLAISFLLIILFPELCIKGASEGLDTCLKIILPSLFPFMVISKYLIYSGYGNKIAYFFRFFSNLFNTSDSGSVAFVVGCVCGSPVGASVICDMVKSNQLTKSQGEHLLGFCSNCGPLFLMGTVGAMLFSDKKIGYFLCFIHIFSAVITGFILKGGMPRSIHNNKTIVKYEKSPFVIAVNDSVNSMLGIFGFIIVFSVICGFFNAFSPIKNDIFNALFCGTLEISCGCIYICALHLPIASKLCLISAICGFSGLCIAFQTMYIIKKTGLDIKPYLKTKILFSIISFCLCFLLCLVFDLFNISFF